MDPIDKKKKAIGLYAIATEAQKRARAGESPMQTQTFINGARRELTRQIPDVDKMQSAFEVSKQYQEQQKPENKF